MPDNRRVPPELYDVQAQVHKAGGRLELLKAFSRGRPDFMVSKGNYVKLIYVAREGELDSIPVDARKTLVWWNGGTTPVVYAAKVVSTPAEAVAFANEVPNPTPGTPDPGPTPPPPPPPDPYQNAFRWSMWGQWDLIATGAPAGVQRIFCGEGDTTAQAVTPGLIMIHKIETTDSPKRSEFGSAGASRSFLAGDRMMFTTEVYFPSNFPSPPAAQHIGIWRLSAMVDGVPPLALLVKKNGAGVDTIWLRHLGDTHDVAAETTLDATGGYMWSTPLVRYVSNTQPNYFAIHIEVKFSTDPSVGWFRVYRDYNFDTPVLAKTFGKTLTDTTGTPGAYVRQGINAHAALTTAPYIGYFNTQWLRERPV